MTETGELVIVGAGLATAAFLQAGGVDARPVIVEFRDRPGGGLRSVLPSPLFAEASSLLGEGPYEDADPRLAATAVGLIPAGRPGAAHTVLVRTARGTERLAAHRVVIASGGLERTREMALIPGSRPAGVVTPVLAHGLLDRGLLPGGRALVYGQGGYVTLTVERLRAAGVETVHMAPLEPGGPRIAGIAGLARVERVTIERDGRREELEVDTLVYGDGMVASTHWLTGSGVELTDALAVRVDERGETNISGIYAIGTCVTPDLDHRESIGDGAALARAVARVRT